MLTERSRSQHLFKNKITMKQINIFSIILFLLFILSCEGQKNSNHLSNKKNEITTATQLSAAQLLLDHDPYFIETTTTTSPIGPSSITRNILQDKKGNLWFATWEGIMHYDGQSFTNYTNKEGLRRWHVFSILEDRTGNIWFGTIGAGVYRYNPKAQIKQFTNFTTQNGLVYDRTGCFYQDKNGTIWIGTEGGISLYHAPLNSQQSEDKLFRNITVEDGLPNNDINSIIEDKNGRMWIGTRGEACYFENGKFTRILNTDGSTFNNVRSIIEDKTGTIWLGGNDGLWSYNASNKNKDGVSYSFTKHSSTFVGYIYEDSKGSIWTGSVGADPGSWVLTRYDHETLPIDKFNATQILTQAGQLFGIIEDHEGAIWFGHERGVCCLTVADRIEASKSLNCFTN